MMSMMITFTKYSVPSNFNRVDLLILLLLLVSTNWPRNLTCLYEYYQGTNVKKERLELELELERDDRRFAWNPLGGSAGLGHLPVWPASYHGQIEIL